MYRTKKFVLISVFLYLFIFITVFLSFFNQDLYAQWLNYDIPEDEKVWIDTSYWTYQEVLVPDGYYREVRSRRWVDDSYTVRDGYWVTRLQKVWVEDKEYISHTEYIYIDTSHYVKKTKEVNYWQPVNLCVIEGTDNYGWDVYSFASTYRGLKNVRYRGEEYKAHKYVIDYRPSWGGRVYAVKWIFVSKKVRGTQVYYEYIRSGYWHPVQVYEVIDRSRWEYREKRIWIDTSYTVTQGHWEEVTDRKWVDTSYYQTEKVFIEDGHYADPLHGKIEVKKSPKYIFTKWHEDAMGNDCHMDLEVGWELTDKEGMPSEKKIDSIYIYEDINRYEDKGTERVIIMKKDLDPTNEGSIEIETYFEHSGDKDSILHIYLYASSGEQVHVYFSNPVNGFRSINLGNKDQDDPDIWLGGEQYGSLQF